MIGFVASGLVSAGSGRSVKVQSTSRVRVPACRRVRTVCMAGTDESEVGDQPVEVRAPLPPEPYPGYYADLERNGMDPYEEMEKKKKKKVGGKASLYRPDGTPYAPWMIGAVQEEPLSAKAAKRPKKSDVVGRMADDPQAQELAGVGLRYKMAGDELILTWATGDETGNMGFVVRRRRAREDTWEKLGDYESNPAELASKGAQGGEYSFLDKNAEPGTWVYRVSDVNADGLQADLSQTIVEVQSEGEQKTQVIALVAVIGILVLFGVLGSLNDPMSGL